MLDIKREMAALDAKDRDFYDNLTEEERKQFSPFMMIRWGATVQGSSDLQEYYLTATNERLNKNFFDISSKNHSKLQWLLATTISPGCGKQYHPWLGLQKKKGGGNKLRKFIEAAYPTMKTQDIDILLQVITAEEAKELAVSMGMTKEQIKAELG